MAQRMGDEMEAAKAHARYEIWQDRWRWVVLDRGTRPVTGIASAGLPGAGRRHKAAL